MQKCLTFYPTGPGYEDRCSACGGKKRDHGFVATRTMANKTPCLPVATLAAPPSSNSKVLLGFVAVSGEWDVSDFGFAVWDLAIKLAEKAKQTFPSATALFNFRSMPGRGHYGHTWFDGTADVYGPSASKCSCGNPDCDAEPMSP